MINFKKVTLTNFLSYGKQPTSFDLSSSGSTLILGFNEDIGDKGGSRNGTGKSSGLQAIVYALFGKGFDKLKSDEFINITNGKGLEVVLEFEKTGKEYKIIRKRKPNAVEVYIDEESITLDTMKNTDEVIEEIIGMDYDVFMTTYFLSPHRDAFMSMTPANQRSMIENMLSLDVLVKRAESLKLIRKDLEVTSKIVQRDVENAERVNSDVNANLERLYTLRDNFESEKNSELKELQETLSLLNEINFEEIEKELKQKELNQATLDSKLQKKQELQNIHNTDISSYKSTESEYNALERTKGQIESLQKQSDSFLTNAEDNIAALQKKYDKMSNIESGHKKIAVIDEIEQLQSEIITILDEVDAITAKIGSEEEKKDALNIQVNGLKEGKCHACGQTHFDEDKLSELEGNIKVIVEAISLFNSTIEKHTKEGEVLEAKFVKLLEDNSYTMDDDFSKLRSEITSEINESEMVRFQLNQAKEDLEKNGNPYTVQLETLLSDYDGDINKLNDKLSELSNHCGYIGQDIATSELHLAEIDNEIKELQDLTYALLDDLDIHSARDIEALKQEKSSLLESIDKTEQRTNIYLEEIKQAQGMLIDADEFTSQLAEIEKDTTHIGYLIKLLTDNKSFIRRNIVDSYIPFVNTKILEYTERLGLPHICSINNDLSTDIEYMRSSVSYFNLSQGERLRLNLSVNLAFRDMITMLGKGSNLLMIDEYMDSAFDHSGLWRSFNLIKEKADTVLLISHREEFKEFVDRTITITKRNGFSMIAED